MTTQLSAWHRAALVTALVGSSMCAASAQAPVTAPATALAAPAAGAATSASPAPAEYVIGPDDVLVINFWREKDVSAEVTVRPDGKVTLPLMNDIAAAGKTPEELRDVIKELAQAY